MLVISGLNSLGLYFRFQFLYYGFKFLFDGAVFGDVQLTVQHQLLRMVNALYIPVYFSKYFLLITRIFFRRYFEF
ncbi:MAG: hypothetical protein U0U70_13395, partial [Chitinophagaceae bacterium]